MKKLSFLSLALMFMSVFSLSSCLGNDDGEDPITPEEHQAAFAAVQGIYSGKVVFTKGDNDWGSAATDTMDVRWDISTDSTLIISNFPMEPLAQSVNDSTLKRALMSVGTTQVKCQTYYTKSTPPTFLLNPYNLTFDLTYDGITHKVNVYFYVYNSYSFGYYSSEKKQLLMQLVEASVTVDESQTSMLNRSVFMKLIGERKL